MHRLPAKLECPEPAVDPGGRLECRLLVYNAAEVVDDVTAVVRGPFAPWAEVAPDSIGLLPRTEGSFEVSVNLPQDARLEAGRRSLLVEARSGRDGTEPSLEEVDVDVGRRTAVTVSLHERPVDEPTEAVYEIRVANHSNHPVSLSLQADTRVRSQVRPTTVAAAPFETAVATLRLARDHGDSDPVPVAVVARGQGVIEEGAAVWPALPEAPAPTPPPRPMPPAGPEPPPPPRPRWGRAVLGVAAVIVVALALLLWRPWEPRISVAGFQELAERPSPRLEADSWEWTWQDMMFGEGIGNGADGFFGPNTEEDTLEFQAREGLPADGIVDGDDWRRMLELYVDRRNRGAVIGWRVEPAAELLEQFGVGARVARERRCGDVADRPVGPAGTFTLMADVVAEIQGPPPGQPGSDEAVLVRSDGQPCGSVRLPVYGRGGRRLSATTGDLPHAAAGRHDHRHRHRRRRGAPAVHATGCRAGHLPRAQAVARVLRLIPPRTAVAAQCTRFQVRQASGIAAPPSTW